jgi:hypothetical protein
LVMGTGTLSWLIYGLIIESPSIIVANRRKNVYYFTRAL